jgi:exopolysaccharide biosynthesis polyprenyl glycosylphosphotransferase
MRMKRKRIEAALLLGVSALGVAGGGAFLSEDGITTVPSAMVLLGMVLLVRTVRRVASGERVLVVGSGPMARRILHAIALRTDLDCDVRCIPEPEASEEPVSERLATAIRAHRADRIIVALEERRGRLPVRTLLRERARGVRVEDANDAYERLTGKVALESLRPGELLFGPGFRTTRVDRVLARVMSVAAAIVGLVLTAPLFPVIALLIKLDSRGPAFFFQPRLGLGGKPFELIKFRTMHPTSSQHTEWEGDNKTRVTRVGRWLRRLHLDELPQLFNVLNGDMNLVGPRPHPVAHADMLTERVPYYELRLLVRPGVTGWAQVRYRYANNLQEEIEKMRYDLYYLKHRSFWLDLTVIPATIRASIGLKADRVSEELFDTPAPTLEAPQARRSHGGAHAR